MNNPWKREGFFYKATVRAYRVPTDRSYYSPYRQILTVNKSLDFISYHIIRLIHGEEKLIDMAFSIRIE